MLQGLSECCTCSQGQVLQQNRWTMLQNIHSICNMLQILGTPGYTYNRHRLLSQNSLEDVKVASASRKSQAWTLAPFQLSCSTQNNVYPSLFLEIISPFIIEKKSFEMAPISVSVKPFIAKSFARQAELL